MDSFYFYLATFLDGNYRWLICGTFFFFALFGFTPFFESSEEKPNAADGLLIVVRKMGVAFLIIGGVIVPIIVITLTPSSQRGFLTRIESIVEVTVYLSLIFFIIGVLIRLVIFRYGKTYWSSWLRKYRFNVSGDKESDIRDVIGKIKTKDFIPSKYYDFSKGVFVGLNKDGVPQYIELNQFLETHSEIIGPTRTGKGVLLGCFAEQLIAMGNTFFMQDPKGDKFLPHIMKEAAEEAGAKFVYCDLNEYGLGAWAPFEGGTAREQRTRLMWALGMKETGSDADFYKLDEKKTLDLILAGNAWSPTHLLNALKERINIGADFKNAVRLLELVEPLTVAEPTGKKVHQTMKKKLGDNHVSCVALKALFEKEGGKVNWGTKLPYKFWISKLSGNPDLQSAIKQLSIFSKETEVLPIKNIISSLSKGGEQEKELSTILRRIHSKLNTDGWSITKLMDVLSADEKDDQAKRALSSLNEMAQISTFTPAKGKGIDWEKILSSETQHVIYIKGNIDDDLIRKMQRLLIIQLGQLTVRLESEGRRKNHVTQIIDEVAFLTSMELSNSLSTIGGSRCNLLLAYQAPSQLRMVSDQSVDGEAVEESIHTNCQNKIIYRVTEPKTAEWASEQTGTIWKTVKRMEKTSTDDMGSETWDNQASYNKVEENYITENVFKGLVQKVGVLITPGQFPSIIYTSFVPTKMKTDFKSDEYMSQSALFDEEEEDEVIGEQIEDKESVSEPLNNTDSISVKRKESVSVTEEESSFSEEVDIFGDIDFPTKD
jgi:hypothetical protein